MDRLTDQQTDI